MMDAPRPNGLPPFFRSGCEHYWDAVQRRTSAPIWMWASTVLLAYCVLVFWVIVLRLWTDRRDGSSSMSGHVRNNREPVVGGYDSANERTRTSTTDADMRVPGDTVVVRAAPLQVSAPVVGKQRIMEERRDTPNTANMPIVPSYAELLSGLQLVHDPPGAVELSVAVAAALEESARMSARLEEALSQPRPTLTFASFAGPSPRLPPGGDPLDAEVAGPVHREPLPHVGPMGKFPSIREDIRAHADYVYSYVSAKRGSRVAWYWKQRVLRMEDRLQREFLRRYAATGDEFGARFIVLAKLPQPVFRSRRSESHLSPGVRLEGF